MLNYTNSNSTISGISDSLNLDAFGRLRVVDTTNIFNSFGETTIVSFEFKETSDGNFIEVIKRQKPNLTYISYMWPTKNNSDRVFKEIYGITRDEGGKKTLRLLRTIEGSVTPGHYVEESIEFPE